MSNLIPTKEELQDKIIGLAKRHGDTYPNNNEALIAAKGYAIGYQEALAEKDAEIKELAGIVKLLLPGIEAIPLENVKVIEQYVEKMDRV